MVDKSKVVYIDVKDSPKRVIIYVNKECVSFELSSNGRFVKHEESTMSLADSRRIACGFRDSGNEWDIMREILEKELSNG